MASMQDTAQDGASKARDAFGMLKEASVHEGDKEQVTKGEEQVSRARLSACLTRCNPQHSSGGDGRMRTQADRKRHDPIRY